MQRDIVFRGQRTDNGQWVEGYYFTTPLTNENIMVPIEDGHYFMCGIQRHVIARNGAVFEVDPATVGQYTGLCDKNGKRIFEGDLVNMFNGLGEQFASDGVVYWINHDQAYCVCKGGMMMRYGDLGNFDDGKCLEIIGNIHDTPELIGGAI